MRAVSVRLRHSVNPARVGTIMRFGFTERQARFLVHVLVCVPVVLIVSVSGPSVSVSAMVGAAVSVIVSE